MSWSVCTKGLVFCLRGQGHSELVYLLTADLFETKLGFIAHHHKLDCLVKRLDCFVVVKVKVTEKVQNSSKRLSGHYLLNCWTFCNWTWYDDCGPVSCKKICLLSSRSRSQWRLIQSHLTMSTISTELLPPKGGRGCLMSPPCLESQGCHLDPLCYLLSCSSA